MEIYKDLKTQKNQDFEKLLSSQLSKNKIDKAVSNIPNVKCTDVNHFSAFDIVKYKKIIFTESALKELEKRYN